MQNFIPRCKPLRRKASSVMPVNLALRINMTSRSVIFFITAYVYSVGAQSAPIDEKVVSQQRTSEVAQTVPPVLKMDIIDVRSAGNVSSVTGDVEYAQYPSSPTGYLKVSVGTEIKNDTMVVFPAGAAVVINFKNERVEFKPADKGRHVIFKIQ